MQHQPRLTSSVAITSASEADGDLLVPLPAPALVGGLSGLVAAARRPGPRPPARRSMSSSTSAVVNFPADWRWVRPKG